MLIRFFFFFFFLCTDVDDTGAAVVVGGGKRKARDAPIFGGDATSDTSTATPVYALHPHHHHHQWQQAQQGQQGEQQQQQLHALSSPPYVLRDAPPHHRHAVRGGSLPDVSNNAAAHQQQQQHDYDDHANANTEVQGAFSPLQEGPPSMLPCETDSDHGLPHVTPVRRVFLMYQYICHAHQFPGLWRTFEVRALSAPLKATYTLFRPPDLSVDTN